mmetsp:Transcript_19641/g.39530  ORF Transcript_19641/g.39530 Transcript_19641/m.39530 type:complete len:82 (+) Transcript_19641:213-458(+)
MNSFLCFKLSPSANLPIKLAEKTQGAREHRGGNDAPQPHSALFVSFHLASTFTNGSQHRILPPPTETVYNQETKEERTQRG